ncbi:MAG: hypothetical protein MUQ00_13600 [Candidatus Aminicenantes bacterium]|nr:hypothetical protein [Candidatus Aminicenantes bacterium]
MTARPAALYHPWREDNHIKNLRFFGFLAACSACLIGWLERSPAASSELGRVAADKFPAWTYAMNVWPFDILYPGTSLGQISRNLTVAVNHGANTVIFYIEEEQMYRTFVDESGFSGILQKIEYLIEQAHLRKLKVICYLNGLEVMAHGAYKNPAVPTLYRNHPEWIQRDIAGKPMVWTGIEADWVKKDMEDAWASPYSGFRDLFKDRIKRLGRKELDAVYIDQASLPGMQNLGDKWASSDAGFASAFKSQYGLSVPTTVNWESTAWRKFVYFRHQAVQEYLQDLADTARAYGIVPFFESSANDTCDGTLLGNEPALSVMSGIAASPEIEPGGDYRTAFRMAKFARDIQQKQPILYLGWPESKTAARKEFAAAVCQSGNYYPTADSPYPANAFKFLDGLRRPVLSRRVPYQEIALIYSARNKDFSFKDERTFDLYTEAFETLEEGHLPFKIAPLETLTTAALQDVGPIVLPGVESMTDAEFKLLSSHPVVLVGNNGTRDQWHQPRAKPLKFPRVIPLPSLKSEMPFTLKAPTGTMIEYYVDRDDSRRFYLFAFSPSIDGRISLKSDSSLSAKIYELDRKTRTLSGTNLTVDIKDYLEVISLQL